MVDSDFDDIFLHAREFTGAEERAAFLSAACGGDAGMRARLEVMLADAEEADAFFEREPRGLSGKGSPPGDGGMTEDTQAVPACGGPGEPGGWIGPYKLLERIGEGGFGIVWAAQQEKPIRRRVALKIIKPGMDTKEVIARFGQERQALAMMDHPNIAKVLDAGATPSGRPYFVMELVRGTRITDYCDEARLPARERLELMAQVCQAVQHAHQKGIIHRDLKPSNILVTLHDGVPVPKVIDFGIAKATQETRLADSTVYTRFEQMIGTPLYMSPEQAEMSGLDIDTRSDIYSLGVLLYELLTGRTPFDPEVLRKAGLEEMRRLIREETPPKPSTALQTMAAATRTKVAQHRRADASKIAGLQRGDLDWIVMKALEKDRTRRYETANGLAQDLRRHLAGEPVSAAPPGAAYRLRKFVRRHRAALLAALLFSGALIAGAVVSVHQAMRARTAEKAADERRGEAEAVLSFLVEVFRSPDPARDGRTITVAEVLDRAARRLETDLSGQPAQQAKLRRTLGSTATALGLSQAAIPLQEKVRDFYLSRSGPRHVDTLAAMQDLARSYFDTGRRREALELGEELVRLRRDLQGAGHPDTLTAVSNLANILEAADRGPDALALREEVLAGRRSRLGPEHRDTLLAMTNLANSYSDAGRRGDALNLRGDAVELSTRILGERDLQTLRAMQALAGSYFDSMRRPDALALRRRVVELRTEILGPGHSDTLGAMADLVNSLAEAGQTEDALRLSRQVLEGCRRTLGPRHPYTLRSMDNLALMLSKAGSSGEALKLQEELLMLSREILGPDKLPTLKTANLLAGSCFATGQRERALKLREEVMEIRLRTYPPDHPDTVLAKEDLAESLFDAGRHSGALKLRQEVLDIRRRRFPPGHPDIVRAMESLAHSQEAMGNPGDAQTLRDEAKSMRQPEPAPPPK
ncbi:MAG: serine/threonine protein kinase [Verrucomicrobiaceae bacterium]|nr:MAG: serine/threonine protein kinase [Verrucomicrobiaceae bacterium]